MKKTLLCLLVMGMFWGLPQAYSRPDLETAITEVAQKVGNATVSISSIIRQRVDVRRRRGFSPFEDFFGDQSQDPFRRWFEDLLGPQELEKRGLGSGVIIDQEGYILTNEHVVSGATEIKVKLHDGREFQAQIRGTDSRSDLAIIKVEAEDLPVAPLGDSSDLKIGSWVVAIGNPFGFAIQNPEPTVTVGVISALHRSLPASGKRVRGFEDLIQTDAAINPGNSGGPLVNLEGEVIGINTAIITTSGGYQGLGFAVPINSAQKNLEKLIKGEQVFYGWLGVKIQELTDDMRSYFGIEKKEGVIVERVYDDSPAAQAGIQEGDLILTYNDESVKTTRDIVRMVSSSAIGQKIALTVLRNGVEQAITVTIGKSPEDEKTSDLKAKSKAATFRGMTVESITPALKQKIRLKEDYGVVISYIEDNSPAKRSGLKVGDVILRIEHKEVRTKQDFIAIIGTVEGTCLVKTNRGYVVLKREETSK